MTAGHLVARLHLAFGGDEDLDHLHNPRQQLVAALQLVDLVVEALFEAGDAFVEDPQMRLDFAHPLVVLDGELAPLSGRVFGQCHVGDTFTAAAESLGSAGPGLTDKKILEAVVITALEDRLFVVAVLGQAGDFRPLDGKRALVLVDSAARENPHLDDGAVDTRR